MISPQIISYIQEERKKNTPDSIIKSNLLANGWSEKDVSDSMGSLAQSSSVSPQTDPAVVAELKKHKTKALWTTFLVLVAVDIALIFIIKTLFGSYGLFGISVPSVLVRILVIYLIASFSTQGSSVRNKKDLSIGKSILKVIGTTIIAIMIVVGIFFVGCVFILLRS